MSADLATTKDAGIRDLIERAAPKIKSVLANTIDSDRFIRLVIFNITRNSYLSDCDPVSLLSCVMTSAELGLSLGGVVGECYAVPFRDKRSGKKLAQFILGYKGIVKKVREADPNIESIEAHVVRKGDDFTWELGLEPKLRHIPRADVGSEVTGAWALVRFKSGGFQRDYMSKAEIERIRKRSKAGDEGPWITDFDEMAKKTVFKRLSKWLSLTPQAQEAIERDSNELGEDVAEQVAQEAIAPAPSRTKRVASKIIESPSIEPPGEKPPPETDEPVADEPRTNAPIGDGSPSEWELAIIDLAERCGCGTDAAAVKLNLYSQNMHKKDLKFLSAKTLQNIRGRIADGAIAVE